MNGKRIEQTWLIAILVLGGSVLAMGALLPPLHAVKAQAEKASGWKVAHGPGFALEAAGWPAPPRGDYGDAADDDEEDAEPRPAPELKKLTAEQINRIRYMELRGMRMQTSIPDRVSVKIPRQTIDDFLVEMEGDPRFGGKRSRRNFLKMTAPQKLNVIARLKGAAYADKVEIRSDPEVFVQFRRNVMPIVLRSCATNGCHSQHNPDAVGFRLFKDPKRTPATTYANFIVLSDVAVGTRPLLDRAQPEKSLLLTYMLPRSEVRVEERHPGDVTYKPTFRSRRTLRFRRIQQWIGSLRPLLGSDDGYGVRLIPKRSKPEDTDQSEPPEPPK